MAQIVILGDMTDALHLDLVNELKVDLKNIDALTDALQNKRTVQLSDVQAGHVAMPFTDYVADASSGTVNLNLAAMGIQVPEEGLMLTNVVASNPDLNVKKLLADGFNLLITGERITVSGQVIGRNVLIGASGEDAAVAEFEAIVEDDRGKAVYRRSASTGGAVFVKVDRASIRAAEAVELSSQLT